MFSLQLLHLVLYLQGDQGFAGEPGPQGQRGAGEPGPKVRTPQNRSLFREAQGFRSVFVQGEPGANGTAGPSGLPGEDGAIGPKVPSSDLDSLETFGLFVTSWI